MPRARAISRMLISPSFLQSHETGSVAFGQQAALHCARALRDATRGINHYLALLARRVFWFVDFGLRYAFASTSRVRSKPIQRACHYVDLGEVFISSHCRLRIVRGIKLYARSPRSACGLVAHRGFPATDRCSVNAPQDRARADEMSIDRYAL